MNISKTLGKFQYILFPIMLTTTLFSYWAGFALWIVNPFMRENLPGYTIGRICMWEVLAIGIAIIISRRMLKKWGNIKVMEVEGKKVISMHQNYGRYFTVYFVIAVVVGIWQFYLFSKQF